MSPTVILDYWCVQIIALFEEEKIEKTQHRFIFVEHICYTILITCEFREERLTTK